jgi:hypothetical protein
MLIFNNSLILLEIESEIPTSALADAHPLLSKGLSFINITIHVSHKVDT